MPDDVWTCEDCGEIEGVCRCPPYDSERERREIDAANARVFPWAARRVKQSEKRGRGRPAGPPTEPITVRIPLPIMVRVRDHLARDTGDSLTAFVARAMLAALPEQDATPT